MVRVARVAPGSIAEEIGMVPGTQLLSVNGRALHPGLYVAKLRATGATGLRSTTRTVRFRILAAPPSSPTAPRFTG